MVRSGSYDGVVGPRVDWSPGHYHALHVISFACKMSGVWSSFPGEGIQCLPETMDHLVR